MLMSALITFVLSVVGIGDESSAAVVTKRAYGVAALQLVMVHAVLASGVLLALPSLFTQCALKQP